MGTTSAVTSTTQQSTPTTTQTTRTSSTTSRSSTTTNTITSSSPTSYTTPSIVSSDSTTSTTLTTSSVSSTTSTTDVTTTDEFESSTESTTESRTSLVWITIPDGTVAPGPEHEYYKTYVFFHYFFRILGFFLFMGGIFLFVRFLYFSGWIPQGIGAPSAAATFKPPPAPPSCVLYDPDNRWASPPPATP